jgi:hypothetical protein
MHIECIERQPPKHAVSYGGRWPPNKSMIALHRDRLQVGESGREARKSVVSPIVAAGTAILKPLAARGWPG